MGQVSYSDCVKVIDTNDHVTGTVKGPQPNTYDVAMYGVNTFIGSLYLCALRCGCYYPSVFLSSIISILQGCRGNG